MVKRTNWGRGEKLTWFFILLFFLDCIAIWRWLSNAANDQLNYTL